MKARGGSEGDPRHLPIRERISSSVLVIFVVGFAGTLGQILILRELLALFYGNELSAAVALGVWLLCVAVGSALASRWLRSAPAGPDLSAVIASLLTSLALMLPGSLLLARASRPLWHVGAGEGWSPPVMLAVAATVAGAPGFLCGALFALVWAQRSESSAKTLRPMPLAVYLGEALGAALAGPLFAFFLLPWLSALEIALCVSAAILIIARLPLYLARPRRSVRPALAWWAGVGLILGLAAGHGRVEQASRIWQWGPNVVATADTAYHNLSLLHDLGQWSLFADGKWWFSLPDRQAAEYDVIPALLQHPNPKTVLLIGGTLSGRLPLVLEHPGIEKVDCVELDPQLVPFVRRHLPAPFSAALDRARVHLHVGDARRFVQQEGPKYDIILMQVGDPVNAGLNRLFSQEFFSLVAERLTANGIFSFGVSAGEDMMGSRQSAFLQSFYRTLTGVFRQVLIIPGDQAHLLASNTQTPLTSDAGQLMQRVSDRKLSLRYIRRDSLEDRFSPFRMSYLKTVVMEANEAVRPNTDFFPVCYRHYLLLWMSQWSEPLKSLLDRLPSLRPSSLKLALGGFGLALAAACWIHPGSVAAVALAVLVTGWIQMIFQVIVLISCQVLAGHLYTRLAWILSSFMAGLALGTALIAGSSVADRSTAFIRRVLMAAQGLVCLYPLAFWWLLERLHGGGGSVPEGMVAPLLCAVAWGAGGIGGGHFALAALCYGAHGLPAAGLGGRLYALDIAGATLGALIWPVLILPLLGVLGSLALLSYAGFIAWLTLLAAVRRG